MQTKVITALRAVPGSTQPELLPNAVFGVYTNNGLYDTLASGVVEGNPQNTDDNGQVTITAPDGIYDLQCTKSDGTQVRYPNQVWSDIKALSDAAVAASENVSLLAPQVAADAAAAAAAQAGAEAARDQSATNASNSAAYTPNRGWLFRAMVTGALPASTLSGDGLTRTFTAQAPVSNTLLDNITTPAVGDVVVDWDYTGLGAASVNYGPWQIQTRGVNATTQEVWVRPAAADTASELGFACFPVQATAATSPSANGGGALYGTDGGKVFRIDTDPATITLGTTPLRVSLTGSINGGSGNGVRLNALETFSPTIYETLDTEFAVWITDAAGRIYATIPDSVFYESLDHTISVFITDANGRVVSAIGAASTGADSSAEVVAARGNTASLSARLSSALTADGALIINPSRPELLRQTHMLLTKRALVEAAQCVMNLAGDSYSHLASRYSGPLTDLLVSRYGDAGGGWCGFGFVAGANSAPWTSSGSNQPELMNGNVRPASYPTTLVGNITSTYLTAASPDLCSATLSAAGDRINQAIPASPIHNACDLFFQGTADGQIRYSWGTYNGSGYVGNEGNYTFGSTTTINVQGTVGAGQFVALAGIPSVQCMLKLEWVAGTVILCGVNLKSAASGVRVNKIAATGSASSNWNAAPATWETVLAGLGGNLFSYLDGTNSQGLSISPAAWGGHIANIFSRARTSIPGIDTLLMTPPENQRVGNPYSMALLPIEARKQQLSSRFCFNDTQDAFGSASNPTEYGSAGAFPLFNPDRTHPEPLTGGRVLVREFMKVLQPFGA